VASDVPGLAGYLEPGRTALVYRPGPALARRQRSPGSTRSPSCTARSRSPHGSDPRRGRDRYLEAVGELVDGAFGSLADSCATTAVLTAARISLVATFSDLFARLDPDPRVGRKQFERVCNWF